MKKLIILVLVVIALFSGCNNNEEVNIYSREFTVAPGQWEFAGALWDGAYYEYWKYEVPVVQLTKQVFEKGVVMAYLMQQNAKSPLPYTIFDIVEVTDGDDHWNIQYEENYSFEFRPNYVTFMVKFSEDLDFPPLRSTFQVVMMW